MKSNNKKSNQPNQNNDENKDEEPPAPTVRPDSPSCFSIMTMSWLSVFVWKAFRGRFSERILPKLWFSCSDEELSGKVDKLWQKEKSRFVF